MTHPTACSKSWTDVNVNFKKRKLGHCCVSVYHDMPENLTPDFFDNSKLIQERRRDTLNGIQHSDCQSCWKDLNNGLPTFKDWISEWKNFDHVKPDVPQVNYIEIEIDNICDLSCLYCSAEHSSKIAQEEGIEVPNKLKENDLEIFQNWMKSKIDNTKIPMTIAFLGGEPTASKSFYSMIDFLSSLDNKYLSVNVTTNCNSKEFLFNKFLDTMSRSNFSWDIHVSNESYKEDSQLIRYGLDWDRFESNLRAYATHPRVRHILFDVAMNSVALSTFPDYVRWICDVMSEYKKPFTIVGSTVTHPSELDIEILPESYKKYVDQAIQILNEANLPNCMGKRKILDFFDTIKLRIGSNHQANYKTIISKFLEEKQQVKKTDKLLRLSQELE